MSQSEPRPTPSYETTAQMYRALLFTVYVPSFLTAICLSSAFLTIPLFALELGADVGATSLVYAMAGLGNVVVVVPAGYLTSRLGDRTVMLSGVALVSVAALFASQATSPLHLSIGAFALGCAIEPNSKILVFSGAISKPNWFNLASISTRNRLASASCLKHTTKSSA